MPALSQDVPVAPATSDSAAALGGTSGLNLDMKLDDLVKQDVVIPGFSDVVNTVDRQESTVSRSPAAVFVITPEMIRRSGARSIPEVLRMAPGVQVAKLNVHTWAITIRGFNNIFADKLLVQIDGRVIYNASSGGVYWDMQDVVLPDVERIEVIRGPGTTMWGSNAVNGVINILTKNSKDTQGALIQSGGGNQERDFTTPRYGGRSGDLTWRIFGQQFDRYKGWSEIGVEDGWTAKHGGFRMDYEASKNDVFTLQGDLYDARAGGYFIEDSPTPPYTQSFNDTFDLTTQNLLGRYGHTIDDDTSWQIQTYYDAYRRDYVLLDERRQTYDIDLQYQFSPAPDHHFITGANYRNSYSFFGNTFSLGVHPRSQIIEWASIFAQDTMTLEEDRWYFTLGTRFEQYTFSGFQVEPTARLLFLPSERQSMWASISRAVRNPTLIDTAIDYKKFIGPPNVPLFINNLGDPGFRPENLLAYEIGYRSAPTDDFFWDIAGYINDYHKLRGFKEGSPEVVPPGIVLIPITFANNARALSYGFETTATLQLTDRWKLFGSYSVFEVNAQGPSLAVDLIQGSTPNNQVYVRSSWDLWQNVEFDVIGRYVDRLAFLDVPRYIEMDTRIAWQATKTLEFSFVGQNLLDSHHLEFTDAIAGQTPTQVRRGWYGMVSWAY